VAHPAQPPLTATSQVSLILLSTPLFVAVINVVLFKRKAQPFLYPALALSMAASAMVSWRHDVPCSPPSACVQPVAGWPQLSSLPCTSLPAWMMAACPTPATVPCAAMPQVAC
jgi:hypothetical protein